MLCLIISENRVINRISWGKRGIPACGELWVCQGREEKKWDILDKQYYKHRIWFKIQTAEELQYSSTLLTYLFNIKDVNPVRTLISSENNLKNKEACYMEIRGKTWIGKWLPKSQKLQVVWIINLFWASNRAYKHCVPTEKHAGVLTPIMKTKSPGNFITQHRIQNKYHTTMIFKNDLKPP